MESAGNNGLDPRTATLVDPESWASQFEPNLLGGVTTLSVSAIDNAVESGWAGRLYREFGEASEPESDGQVQPATLIPYFVWANREPGPMSVWLAHE